MNNRKGFTMVELLAVIVILGILMAISIPAVSRWVNRSKNENLESQKQTLIMASKSYAQANKGILPKEIGSSVAIKVTDLRNANFLNEDIRNADKKSCMENSFVRIYK